MIMMRSCIECGEVSEQAHCAAHRPTGGSKLPPTQRGYDHRWRVLSERARRLQPFCSDCGAITDLQTDHTPQAWARKAAGKPLRLQDIDVVCGPCNRARGAARGQSEPTRGHSPANGVNDPQGAGQICVTHRPRKAKECRNREKIQ